MDRFVIGYLFSGRFEVFQLQGNQAILQWKEDKFPFKYNVADGRVRIPISTKYGYVDLDCTDNYIYALYSGKSREEDYFPTYSTVIEVYNWNGEQVAELELNTPVGQIAISSDNKYIYGAGLEDNVIGLFQAELPVL